VLDIVSYAISIVSIVCFIYIVIKFFTTGHTGWGIASLVGLCVCGIGGLIALVGGWLKSTEMNVRPVMLIWTVAVIAGIAMNFVHPSPLATQFQAQMQQLQQQQGK
jgi:hypothetical protein